jgi:hypothetical protein
VVAAGARQGLDLDRRRLVPVQDVQLGAVAAAPIPALQGRHPSPSPSPCRRTRPCPMTRAAKSSAPPPGRTGGAWRGRSARRVPRQRPAAGPHQAAASRPGRGGRDGSHRTRDRHPLPGCTGPSWCCRSTFRTLTQAQPTREEDPDTMGSPFRCRIIASSDCGAHRPYSRALGHFAETQAGTRFAADVPAPFGTRDRPTL